MAQPIWITPAGNLGTIAEGAFYQIPLQAYEPTISDPVFFEVIAGQLPTGIQVTPDGLLSGIPQTIGEVRGVPTEVGADITSKFAVRAYTVVTIHGQTVINRLADRTFTITVTGQDAPEFVTPPGKVATVFDGSLITGIQIEYTDPDPNDTVIIRLVSGALPPGCTINRTGLISGYIAPFIPNPRPAGYSRDLQGYDQYPYDFSNISEDITYEFTLEISDGKASNVRTFSIEVYSRDGLTADTTLITADNTFLTADGSPRRAPIILTPEGSIGVTQSDNFFAFQFQVIDVDGDPYRFLLNEGDSSGIPGLVLDRDTGWLYGYIPDLGLDQNVFDFSVQVYQTNDPDAISKLYNFSLTVTGPINSEITWLTSEFLGDIINGSTSTLYVQAVSKSGLELTYQLLSGSNSSLPQGLQLLPSGDIAGRVSFDTFTLDTGTTTFDVRLRNRGVTQPTTFDLTFHFIVQATSVNGVINVIKKFYIRVIRRYQEPYENLYMQAMPPQNDRDFLNNFLENYKIFSPDILYRPTDPNFGVARDVVYVHAYGLRSSTIDEYYSSLYENHYWKNLILGQIEVAQATDAAGKVIYEVVYSRVIDDLVNNQGQSVNKQVNLAYPVLDNNLNQVSVVYPNSLINMRDQVIDVVGQISNELPAWMISKQRNGRILGFTPAWVMAYVKPGKGAELQFRIQNAIGDQLNLIDFEVDRYEVDSLLSKNWNAATGQWVPSPPTYTTFDAEGNIPTNWINNNQEIVVWINNYNQVDYWYSNSNLGPTIFDGNSMMFIDPVDMYVGTLYDAQIYDKYLVFPKRNILG
jgi:hypothetical protein